MWSEEKNCNSSDYCLRFARAANFTFLTIFLCASQTWSRCNTLLGAQKKNPSLTSTLCAISINKPTNCTSSESDSQRKTFEKRNRYIHLQTSYKIELIFLFSTSAVYNLFSKIEDEQKFLFDYWVRRFCSFTNMYYEMFWRS